MDSLKMEKAKAFDSFNNRTMKIFMLLFELCLGLVMASCLLTCVFTWVPLAVKVSAAHLGGSLAAFLLCNAVVLVVVFLKNSDSVSSAAPKRLDLYDEFVAASQARRSSAAKFPAEEETHIGSSASGFSAPPCPDINDDFVAGSHARRRCAAKSPAAEETHIVSSASGFTVQSPAVEVGERTQPDDSEIERGFRRSETDDGQRKAAVEELSNEEFRLKIESFIAAQRCNLMKVHDMVLGD